MKIEQDEGQGGGVTVLFDVADFETVAAVMQPRKRRRLSEERKSKMRASGQLFGPGGRRQYQNTSARSVPTTQPDPEATPAA